MNSINSISNRNFKLIFSLFLLFIGLVNFWDSFKNPFFLDDADFLLNSKKQNPKFFFYNFIPNITSSPGFENFENSRGYFRPLHHFLMSLESAFFDNNAFYYQIISFTFFIIACYSIFLLLLSLTSNRFLAAAASLLYLLHPFQGLCVNYKTAFVFSLQITFLNLIFIYIHKLYKDKIFFRIDEYFLYLVLFCFAILLNEIAFVFPLVVLLYILLNEKITRRHVLVYLGFVAIFLFYIFFRSEITHTPGGVLGAILGGFKIAWWESCAAYARIIRWVILKLVYPQNIFIQWTTYVDKHMADRWIWVFVFYVVVFFYFSWFFYKRNKMLLFFWLMFSVGFLLSAPASYGILGSGFFYFEPHWIFYTNIGFFALLAWGIDRTRKAIVWLPYLLLFILATAYIYLSHQQNKLFNNIYEYEKEWSKETPGFELPQLGICGALQQQGRIQKAITCFESLEECSRKAGVYSTLANLYLTKKNYKKAKEYYRKFLALNNYDVLGYRGLAYIAIQEEDYSRALQHLDTAQKYDIFSIEIFIMKMYIYEKQKKYEDVLKMLNEVEKNYYVKEQADLVRARVFFLNNQTREAEDQSRRLIESSKNFDILIALREILINNKENELLEIVDRKLFFINFNRAKNAIFTQTKVPSQNE